MLERVVGLSQKGIKDVKNMDSDGGWPGDCFYL